MYDDRLDREHYYASGSAGDSGTPAVNFVMAGVMLAVVVFGAPSMPIDTNGWALTAMITWLGCMFAFVIVGAWAQQDKRDPDASLADLLPQRVTGWIIGMMAILPAIMLIPL